MQNIEVEVRSFITKNQYYRLMKFFKSNGKLLKKDSQETHYFDTKQDLRIQKNNYFSKIWLKKGKIHDTSREEIEIKMDRENFASLEKLFVTLGFETKIKWFRKRNQFKWKGITVCLDYTKGYGYILELEKMCSKGSETKTLAGLKKKLELLKINLTPKKIFEKKFSDYEKNWKKLV